MRSSDNSVPSLDFSYFTRGLAGGLPFSAKFYKQIRVSDPAAITPDQKKALAASVQGVATEIIAGLLTSFAREHNLKSVCLGGGIFQNALRRGFDRLALGRASKNGCRKRCLLGTLVPQPGH
jgi:predicted NodU family carbamoyl transferase